MTEQTSKLDPRASIMLMGLRGSGKSTLGVDLSLALDRRFIDLDDETVKYLGHGTISELFEKYGEQRFRAAEYRALVNQAVPLITPGPVVALGGGTPTAPGAADFLTAASARREVMLIYLRGTPDTLAARLQQANNANRPALVGDDPISEVQQVFDARDGLYQQLATATLDIDELDRKACTDRLEEIVRDAS
ncbi:MAG: shikimate kinase [Planctomycetota bacterium]